MRPEHHIGRSGEVIARLFLMKQGHSIVGNNYKGNHYELDIVSRYADTFYVFEVKSVSYETPVGHSLMGTTHRAAVYLTNIYQAGVRIFSDPAARDFLGWRIIDASAESESLTSEYKDLLMAAAERVDERKVFHMKHGVESLIHRGVIPHDVPISIETITVMLDFFRKTAIIQRIPYVL